MGIIYIEKIKPKVEPIKLCKKTRPMAIVFGSTLGIIYIEKEKYLGIALSVLFAPHALAHVCHVA